MRASCDTRFPSLIDELLLQELPARKLDQLSHHLQGCVSCQRRYNKIVLAQRLLTGGPEALTTPSAGEVARVRRRVFEQLGKPRGGEGRGALPRWVAALASTAAAVALMVPLLSHELSLPGDPVPALPGDPVPALPGDPVPALPGDPAPDGRFQPRGAAEARPTDVKLRTLCIHGAGEPRILDVSSTDNPAQPRACGLADVLRFTYSNRSERRFLFLVGLDEQYGIKWYEPHPPRKQSIPLKSGVVDQALSRGVELAVNHRAGAVRIFALFSDEPLSSDQITRGVERARAAQTPLEKIRLLELAGVDQQSVTLGLTP